MEDQWIFTPQELQQVPSIASGSKNVAEERQLRMYGCNYIQAIGGRLDIPQLTISTAMVYFHRFFARESFDKYRYEVIAATCVYLACKVEESSRKAMDIVQVCMMCRKSRGNHNDEKTRQQLFAAILQCEHTLLDTLCFDFTVQHPHQPLLDFASELQTSEKILQAAWAFANDSLRLTLCLLYEPHLIAVGCLLLAYRLNGEQIPLSGDLAKTVEDSYDALQYIVRNIMQIYSSIEGSNRRNSRQVGTGTTPSTIQVFPNTLILDVAQ
ncbi:cyclin-like protein [Fennellomyces sp. T-0311]|nr:cyclin-like protein [Fennellomyces sp. T-0311]